MPISVGTEVKNNTIVLGSAVSDTETSLLTSLHTQSLSQPPDPSFMNVLNEVRKCNINKIIFGHLNINSIRNKFEFLVTSIENKIDILIITETKIDD